MKVVHGSCWALLGLLGITQARGQDLSPTEVFKAASPSVVVIEALDADGRTQLQGSGVVVAVGQVVTNCHVVDQARVLVVRERTGDRYGELRYRDPKRDLCQLSVSSLDAVPVKTRPVDSLQIGESVYAIGAPRGLELTLSNGLVSSLRPLQGAALIQTTAAISPGSSGGGLFDAQGRLVGITTLYLEDSQSLNFAVPTDWIWVLPERSRMAAEAARVQKAEWDRRVKVAKEKLNALEKWLESKYANYRELRPQFVERGKKAVAGEPPEQWPEIALATFLQVAEEAEKAKQAAAARWRLIYQDDDLVTLVDQSTVSRTGNLVTAWHEDRYTDPGTAEEAGGARTSRIQATWNCADRSFRYEATYVYDDSGELLEMYQDPPNGRFGPVVPSTLNEIKWTSVCQ